MRCFAIIAALFMVLGFAACSGEASRGLSAGAPPFDLGPLPDDSRSVSALSRVNGADYIDAGPGASVSGTSAVLVAGAGSFSWALYSVGIPAGARLNRIDLSFDATPTEVWLALADYGKTGSWQWFGPKTGDFAESFGEDYQRYRSPAGNLYWVLVAAPQHPAGGSASLNHSTVDYSAGGIYLPPPGGTQTVATGSGRTPSLAMMDNEGLPGQKAPVIAYTLEEGAATATKLHVAYYDGSTWVDTAVLPEFNFSRPKALWLPNARQGVIAAYNLTTEHLQELIFDGGWQLQGITDIAPNPGLPFFDSSFDVDPTTGELGLAHSYVGAGTGKLYYSRTASGVWQTSEALFDSSTEGIAGVCFRFDPRGGNPWMFFTHGTLGTESLPLIDTTLQMGRRSGATWGFVPVEFTDPAGHSSPLRVDLIFDGSVALLAFTAARDYQSMDPGFVKKTSLLLDSVVGRYSGAWAFFKVQQATVDVSVGFPPLVAVFELDGAFEMNWTQLGELQYSRVQGYVGINTNTELPTGGSFSNSVAYRYDFGGSWQDLPYFTGDPGRDFSWRMGTFRPVCAYVHGDSIDYHDVLSGNWEAAGEIHYWSPTM